MFRHLGRGSPQAWVFPVASRLSRPRGWPTPTSTLKLPAFSFSPKAAPWSSSQPSELDWLQGGRGPAVWKDLQARGYQLSVCLLLPPPSNAPQTQGTLPLSHQKVPIPEGKHLPQGIHLQEFGFQVLPWGAESRGGSAQGLAPRRPLHGAHLALPTLCQLHRVHLERDAVLPGENADGTAGG